MIIKVFGNIVNNLGDIRLFVEAANLGGLSAAGRKLGLSPAAQSRWQTRARRMTARWLESGRFAATALR
jgi:hypothetical protein